MPARIEIDIEEAATPTLTSHSESGAATALKIGPVTVWLDLKALRKLHADTGKLLRGFPRRTPAHKCGGCGSTNLDDPDHEGVRDCLDCGVFTFPDQTEILNENEAFRLFKEAGKTYLLDKRTGKVTDADFKCPRCGSSIANGHSFITGIDARGVWCACGKVTP